MTPPPTAARKLPPNFDTAKLRDGLVDAGVTDQAAKVVVTAMVESQANLATKVDLNALRQETNNNFALMRKDMETALELHRNNMEAAMKLHRKDMETALELQRKEAALSEKRMKIFTLTQTVFILAAVLATVVAILKFDI